MAPEVDGDHPVAVGQVAQLVHPEGGGQHEPVEQDERRALAAFDDVDPAAVGGVDEVMPEVVGQGQALARVISPAVAAERETARCCSTHPAAPATAAARGAGGEHPTPSVALRLPAAHLFCLHLGPRRSHPQRLSTTTRGTRGPMPQSTS